MAENSKYAVEITANTAQFQSELARASAAAQSASRSISQAFGTLKSAAAFIIGIPLGIAGLASAFDTLKEKTIESQRSLAQLDAVLKSTGASAGLTRDALEQIGKGLSKKTVFAGEEIRSAEVALLQFRAVSGDVFKEALATSADLATRLGVGLPEAARLLGRALEDPSKGMRGLKASGIDLSNQQIDLAARFTETGQKSKAAAIVLGEIAKSIGGAAEADNSGVYGATKRLTKAWDELVKAAGRKVFEDNGQQIEKLAGFFDRLVDRISATKTGLADLADSNFLRGKSSAIISDFTGSLGLSNLSGPPGSRLSGGKISGQVGADEAKAAAAKIAADEKAAADAEYTAQQERLKALADGAAAYYAGAFAALKAHLAQQSSALDFSYHQNEISSAAYYDEQRKQAEAAFQAQNDFLLKQAQAKEARRNSPNANMAEQIKLMQEMETLSQQSHAAAAERDLKLQKINQDQISSVDRLADSYAHLNVELLALSGDTVGAANAAFIQAHKDDQARIRAELNSPNQANSAAAAQAQNVIVSMQMITDSQARLNKVNSDFGLILSQVSNAEASVAARREAGNLSELGALAAISEANAARIPQLRAMADAYAAMSEKIRTTADAEGRISDLGIRAQATLDAMRLKLEQLGATGDLVAKKFNDIFADAFVNGLTDIVTGTKSVKDAFKDMERSIVAAITRIAAQEMATKIFGGSGGIGSFFSQIFGKGGFDWGSLFGSSGGISPGAFIPPGGGYAGGTDFARGGLTLVGERGPELVNMRRGAQVIPNDVLRRGGMRSVINNITISVPASTSGASADQIAMRTGAAIQRAMRRNA